MRRATLPLVVAASIATPALAGFGIFKTHVDLPRSRPPQFAPMTDTVAVDVRSDAPEITRAHVDLVRSRLERALATGSPSRLVEDPGQADGLVRVTLSALSAEVRDEVKIERRRVKLGEGREWNAKKQVYETKDIYGDRDVPVTYRIAEGSLQARLELDGSRSLDLSNDYHEKLSKEGTIPPEASSEEGLRRHLIEVAAARAADAVSYQVDPVEALLATNGELKDGNELAKKGLWEQALATWQARQYRGDTEAARLHNVGVATEALAYRLPPYDPQHLTRLQQARDYYRQAIALDPGEKYFKDPLARIEISLQYAANAAQHLAELDARRDEARQKREARAAATRPARPPAKTGAPAKPALPSRPAPAQPAAGEVPLRNGSFESALSPWTLAGKGAILEEAGRGRTLELVASPAAASISQPVTVAAPEGRSLVLALEYRVTAGEAQLKAVIGYLDTAGKLRSATLPVSAGEGPGGWASWDGDLAALRPRPARLKDVKLMAEGGTVRVDNVALTAGP